jgi:hypothetical protein
VHRTTGRGICNGSAMPQGYTGRRGRWPFFFRN